MSDEQPMAKPVRTWGPMALWTAVILAALGLAWFVGAVVVPVFEVRAVVREWHTGGYHPMYNDKLFATDIKGLGGPQAGVRKLSLYLLVPESLAPHKEFVVSVLGECGEPAIPKLEKLLKHKNPSIRQAALRALEKVRCAEAEKLMLGRVVQLLRESGYWRGYPLQSVKRDMKRQQWEFLFSDGRTDSGYAAFITDENSERIDILLFPPMWTKYERKKSLDR